MEESRGEYDTFLRLRNGQEDAAQRNADHLREFVDSALQTIVADGRRALARKPVPTPPPTPPSPPPSVTVPARVSLSPSDLTGTWLVEVTNPFGVLTLYEMTLRRKLTGKRVFTGRALAEPWSAQGQWSIVDDDGLLLEGRQTMAALPFPQGGLYANRITIESVAGGELTGISQAGWRTRLVRR